MIQYLYSSILKGNTIGDVEGLLTSSSLSFQVQVQAVQRQPRALPHFYCPTKQKTKIPYWWLTKCKIDSRGDQTMRGFFNSEPKENWVSSYFPRQACLPTKHRTMPDGFMVLFVKTAQIIGVSTYGQDWRHGYMAHLRAQPHQNYN